VSKGLLKMHAAPASGQQSTIANHSKLLGHYLDMFSEAFTHFGEYGGGLQG
jgi:hypothetical protein